MEFTDSKIFEREILETGSSQTYISGDFEFERREGYRRSPRYLYRSTHSPLSTILAGSIPVRLQYHSLSVNVRIRFLF